MQIRENKDTITIIANGGVMADNKIPPQYVVLKKPIVRKFSFELNGPPAEIGEKRFEVTYFKNTDGEEIFVILYKWFFRGKLIEECEYLIVGDAVKETKRHIMHALFAE